jgi:hypothetical protein
MDVAQFANVYDAADYLNVSLGFFRGLLESGEIKACPTNRSWVLWSDLKAYKQRSDRKRSEALDELARLGEEMGDYDG